MPHSTRGFTLLEVLAALGIFAIALASLPPLLVTAVRTNAYARRMSTATVFAQDKLEVLRNTPYAAITSGTDQVTESGRPGTYTRTWTVTAGPTATTKRLVVAVSWTDRTTHHVQVDGVIGG